MQEHVAKRLVESTSIEPKWLRTDSKVRTSPRGGTIATRFKNPVVMVPPLAGPARKGQRPNLLLPLLRTHARGQEERKKDKKNILSVYLRDPTRLH